MLFQNVSNVFAMLVLHYRIELLHIVEILLIKFWQILMLQWVFLKKWYDDLVVWFCSKFAHFFSD